MKKRSTSILVAFLCVIATLLILVPAGFASDSPVFSVEAVTEDGGSIKNLKPGDIFTVYVNITENSKISAIDYNLYFDKNQITPLLNEIEDEDEPQWIIPGEVFSGPLIGNYQEENSLIAVSGAGSAMKTGGILFSVRFQVNDNASLGQLEFKQEITNATTRNGNDVDTQPAKNVISEENTPKVEVFPVAKTLTLDPNPYTLVVGGTFNPSDISATIQFDNGTSVETTLSDDAIQYDSSNVDTSKVGTYEVSVSYVNPNTPDAVTAKLTVDVEARKVSEITVSDETQSFIQGQDFSTGDGVINVVYEDGGNATIPLDASYCSGYDLSKVGDQTVTVTYDGKTTTYSITVTKKEVISVELIQNPTELNYTLGVDTELNTDGGLVKVSYNNGKSEEIALTPEMCSGYSLNKEDKYTVTVTYDGITSANTFQISVTKEVKKLVFSSTDTLTAYVGDSLNKVLEGITVKAVYSDNTESTAVALTDKDVILSGVDLNVADEYTLKVEYLGKTQDAFEIKVLAVKAESLEISNLPDQTYPQGLIDGKLNLDGAVLKVTYNNGTTKEVALSEAEISEPDFNTLGIQKISVSYEGITTEFEIDIVEPTVTALELESAPTTLYYVAGRDTTLDLTGGILEVTYDNLTTESIDLTADMIANEDAIDFSKAGTYSVNILYAGFSIDDAFTVQIGKEVKELVVVPPTKLSYIAGETDSLDLAGGTVTPVYYDGVGETVDLVDSMLVGEVYLSKAGSYPVSVSYAGKTEENAFTITVDPVEITSSVFTTPTEDQTYISGSDSTTLNLTGAKWEVTYNNGKSAVIDVTEAMCSDYSLKNGGAYTVAVKTADPETGADLTGSFNIIVKGLKIEFTADAKTVYMVGEAFSLEGITISFFDGTELIPLTAEDVTVSGYDAEKVGKQTVVISYVYQIPESEDDASDESELALYAETEDSEDSQSQTYSYELAVEVVSPSSNNTSDSTSGSTTNSSTQTTTASASKNPVTGAAAASGIAVLSLLGSAAVLSKKAHDQKNK